MIFSTAVVVSVLTLLSITRATTIRARQDDCPFVCPDSDLDGNALYSSANGDAVITCSYSGDSFNSCAYDSTSGVLVGDGDCPERAVQQCVTRRGVSDEPEWKHYGSPGPDPKRDVPSTPAWPPYNPSPSWSPSPSKPNPKPSSPPSTPQPCKFRCPLQDLAKNLLTDGAFREPDLFCSYSTPHCKTCSFCRYNTKTGALVEDNDDGNCPKKALPARPWDSHSD